MCVTTPNEKNIYQKPMEELKSERPETKIQKQIELIYREGKQVVSGKARGGEES